jgi:ubiquinone/menaquinone biosynthesis C-methylase UbiE
MTLMRTAAFGIVAALFVTACTIPPLSNVIYRVYSDAWPPARASKVIGLLNGRIHFAVLKAALDFNVFELLNEEPRNAKQLAPLIGADERGLAVLMEYLSTLDLVHVTSGGTYSLGGAARVHLVKSSPDYVGGFVALFGSDSMETKMLEAKEAVQRGGADPFTSHDGMAEKAGENQHSFWSTFARDTVEFSVNPANALADLVLSSLSKKTGPIEVLDVACGTGTYGFILAQRHDGIRVTSLDQQNVISHTRKWAQHFGVADRVSYIEGSIFNVSLPSAAYGMILVPHFIHHFDSTTNVVILKKLAASLTPGGQLVINDFIRAEGAYSPWKNPMPFQFDFSMLISTEKGQTYSVREVAELLDEAGLRLTKSSGNFPLPNTYIVAALG